ncbi:DUF1249 domain-containing protein, partial [Escherichia sp. HC-CC]
CSSQQIFRFKARYDYPNKKLHQRDEKHQINQFLADWLRYCLAHGAMAHRPVYVPATQAETRSAHRAARQTP